MKIIIGFVLGLCVASAWAESDLKTTLPIMRVMAFAATDPEGIMRDIKIDREGRVICAPQ